MKERPILFSGPMVRAILDGRKTMTRRVLKPYNVATTAPKHEIRHKQDDIFGAYIIEEKDGWKKDWCGSEWKCPYGQPGDRLWVRETWGIHSCIDATYRRDRCEVGKGLLFYKSDHYDVLTTPHVHLPINRWRPSIHMPRWASRITLEVTGVRVERLQDISEEDAFAEGVIPIPGPVVDPDGSQHMNWCREYREGFESLWDSINAKRGFGWDVNPWVWVIHFRRVK